MPTTPTRVAVVGAGPGGLVCAAVLQRGGVDVTVLEDDASPSARDQGGTLDLHPETGQAALAHAGLVAAFTAHARPEGQESRQYTPDGVLTEHTVPGPDDMARPEIDRHDLRRILLDALEPGSVRWGVHVRGVDPLSSGRARLHLDAAGSSGPGLDPEFDLVVGADGAWSRIRPAVSPAIPRYSGNTLVETWLDDVERRHPAVAELVGAGTTLAADPADPRLALLAQRTGAGRVLVYAALREDAGWLAAAGVDPADDDAITTHLLGRTSGWAPALRALLAEHDRRFVERPIHTLPVGHRWDHVPGVTLLGDAAHLMAPAGEGANHALLDGAELAAAIVDTLAAGGAVDDAVRGYEATMFPRAAQAAAFSAAVLDPDAA